MKNKKTVIVHDLVPTRLKNLLKMTAVGHAGIGGKNEPKIFLYYSYKWFRTSQI